MKKNIPPSSIPSLIMGCVLCRLRQQAGLDQRGIARCLGITQASWSRIENGHATANIAQIINSCNTMGIDFLYVAQLYTYICNQLVKKSVVLSNDNSNFVEVRAVIKEVISEHFLSGSSRELNIDL
jgi:transcriptional regulator with XRE-family HTH domain